MLSCATTGTIIGIACCIYLLASGARARQVSGFTFYLVAAVVQSVPALLVLTLDLLTNQVPSWMYALGLAMLLGYGWRIWQEEKMRKGYPSRWRAWVEKAAKAKHSNPLDKLLLPGVRE